MKPRIWKSRNGYWICHGQNRFGVLMQGYGYNPSIAWTHWYAGYGALNLHVGYINQL